MITKSEVFAAASDAIRAAQTEKELPLSLAEMKKASDLPIAWSLQKIDDPVAYLTENCDLAEPKLRSALNDLILASTRSEFETEIRHRFIAQFADDYETTMTSLVGTMKERLSRCGSVGWQMIRVLDEAMQSPRVNIKTLAICISQVPAVVARNLSLDDRDVMTAIAKPFDEAMQAGLAKFVAMEAGIALKTSEGPFQRFIASVPTGEEIAFDTKIRFVYDSVDDRLLFSQEFDGEGERWGSLDAMSPDELQTWVKDNLKQMTPEKLGWSNSDELPIWAISGFRNFGMG